MAESTAESAGDAHASCDCFSYPIVVIAAVVCVRSLVRLASSSAPPLSFCCKLARLAERLPKVLVMLTTLSFRITDDADARTSCSLLERAVIPGKGKMSLVQTSDKRASSRALSAREGASTGMRLFVVRSDCDLLIWEPWREVEASLTTLVFFSMT
jgi:hypothetical protein